MTRWKSLRHRLEAALCAWLVRNIPRLSRRNCVRLGNLLGGLAFRLDKRGRSAALENLRCVYGAQMAEGERRRIALASYRNFARTMLDLFWGQRLTKENFREYIQLEGLEALQENMARAGSGAIFMCVHQGNWEWASLTGGFTGHPLSVVTEGFKNPLLTHIFAEMRQRTGQEMIAQENSLVRMLKIVKRNGLTGMLIDLNLRPGQAATVVEAFAPRLKMCVPLLHSVLAQRAGALLLPIETEQRADGTCRITVHAPVPCREGASLQEITQACWDTMEPFILARPEQWLWAYKHFRYRPKGTTTPYPAYAHESGQFEKLQRELAAPPGTAKRKKPTRAAAPPAEPAG